MDYNAALLGVTSAIKEAGYALQSDARIFPSSNPVTTPRKRKSRLPGIALGIGALGAAGYGLHKFLNPAHTAATYEPEVTSSLVAGLDKIEQAKETMVGGLTPEALRTQTSISKVIDPLFSSLPGMDNPYVPVSPILGGVVAGALTSSKKHLPTFFKANPYLSAVSPAISGIFGYQQGVHPLTVEAWSDILGTDLEKTRNVTGPLYAGVNAAISRSPVGVAGQIVSNIVLDHAQEKLDTLASTVGERGAAGDFLLENLRKMKQNGPDSLTAANDVMAWRNINRDKIMEIVNGKDSPAVRAALNRATGLAANIIDRQ